MLDACGVVGSQSRNRFKSPFGIGIRLSLIVFLMLRIHMRIEREIGPPAAQNGHVASGVKRVSQHIKKNITTYQKMMRNHILF